MSPALAGGFFTTEPPGKPCSFWMHFKAFLALGPNQDVSLPGYLGNARVAHSKSFPWGTSGKEK